MDVKLSGHEGDALQGDPLLAKRTSSSTSQQISQGRRQQGTRKRPAGGTTRAKAIRASKDHQREETKEKRKVKEKGKANEASLCGQPSSTTCLRQPSYVPSSVSTLVNNLRTSNTPPSLRPARWSSW
eukprot:2265275-Amphidinium_carterae.1